MTDRQQLAEDAARAMGWWLVGCAWLHKDTDEPSPWDGQPSLDDPAFCWAMLEWLSRRHPRFDGTNCEGSLVIGREASPDTWPEALARAVIATKEEA